MGVRVGCVPMVKLFLQYANRTGVGLGSEDVGSVLSSTTYELCNPRVVP